MGILGLTDRNVQEIDEQYRTVEGMGSIEDGGKVPERVFDFKIQLIYYQVIGRK